MRKSNDVGGTASHMSLLRVFFARLAVLPAAVRRILLSYFIIHRAARNQGRLTVTGAHYPGNPASLTSLQKTTLSDASQRSS
jgi:hypothetical protein